MLPAGPAAAQSTPATVTLSASPAQVWEGQVSRVTATLSHALPNDVWLGVTVTPCPSGSWCHRFNSYPIYIPAGFTSGHLKGPVDPSAQPIRHTPNIVSGEQRIGIGGYWLYAGPQTSLLTVRDADAEHEEITVALKSSLAKNVIAGGKTSQKITVLDPDGFAMTITADKQPAEGGGVVKVTVDLGQPAPAGFFAKINSSASTAKFGYSVNSVTQPDWTMDGKVQVEEPYVAAGPVLPRSTSSARGPCIRKATGPGYCLEYISADDWNNRDWQRMHYVKDWNGASRKSLTIQIADDDFVDPGETIVLQGIGYIYATGIDHGGSTGFPKGQVQSNELTLTIKDNDGGGAADDRIEMGALDTIVRESGTGADSTARVPVWLSRPATQPVSVNYGTSEFSATPGTDYTAVSGTLTFAVGETRKAVEIPIKDDNMEDSGEIFTLSLSNPRPSSVVRLADADADVTIINDEADLEGLKLWGATGAGGPYARLDLGAFDGAVSDYAVTVPHGTTHAKLAGIAPQNEHLGLKAGRAGSTLTAVRSNVAGPAVPLAVGDTVLVVQSTASTGERKTYRVTVTREAQVLSSDADLSGLSAEAGAGGSWTALDLGAFAAGTTTYAATVPHGTTQVRLTATAANAGATLKAGAGANLTAVASGTASAAIALDVGANALKVEVTAADGTVKTYAVTVTRVAAPAAVAVSLSATPNPVGEGSPVTVRATLAKALSKAVTIPLTVTRGTSEDGDHGSLASIEIPAGFTSATGTISTVDDEDGDDETFTVALGSLPSGLTADATSSVEVTITDGGAQQQQALEPLTAAFENGPLRT